IFVLLAERRIPDDPGAAVFMDIKQLAEHPAPIVGDVNALGVLRLDLSIRCRRRGHDGSSRLVARVAALDARRAAWPARRFTSACARSAPWFAGGGARLARIAPWLARIASWLARGGSRLARIAPWLAGRDSRLARITPWLARIAIAGAGPGFWRARGLA